MCAVGNGDAHTGKVGIDEFTLFVGTMRAPGVGVPPDADSQHAAPVGGAGAGGGLLAGGAYAAVEGGAVLVGERQ